MILQLEVEEKMGRRTRVNDCVEMKHIMSCVNSSDILRSARNALNQYLDFHLLGKIPSERSAAAAAAIIKRSEMNELIMERRRSSMAATATATARKKGMMVGACSRTGPG
ncbi:hypothetical protein ACJIZ3_008737 [Penstemon smallii]|uniref:Uncharacterized protein n=1 Tax=Penstemon smallii TaxID=265156 RepID=A0ABD3TBL5_9LAMI